MAIGDKRVKVDALKAVYDHVTGEMDDLKSAFENLVDLDPIETRNYLSLQMGSCFESGVSIDNMNASTKNATIPERIDATRVFTLYWDDSVYKLGLVPLNDNGTGTGSYYWIDASPYTTAASQSSVHRTFMIRRKDSDDIGDVDLNRILYMISSESNPIADLQSAFDDISAELVSGTNYRIVLSKGQ